MRLRFFSLEFPSLPATFDRYTIVFASDFHVRRIGRYENKVLEVLASLRGNLLILGGDYQNHRKKSAGSAMAFVDAVGEFAAHFADGIVAVRGNHDSRPMRGHLKRHGAIRYLSGTSLVIEREGAKIAISGARKWPKKERERMNRAVRRLVMSIPDAVSFRILVAHWPDYYPAAQQAVFDLVLSGDTHGGQVRLPLIGPLVRKTRMPRRYVYGFVREGQTTLYTTSGLGTRGLPLRLFCPSEIVVLELRARNSV